MYSTSSIETLEVKNNTFTTQANFSQFGLASISINSDSNELKYKITSENDCLNMQLFFSKNPISSSLFFGNGYSRLRLGTNPNDLGDYFQLHSLPTEHDLTSQLSLFSEKHQISKSANVYLNFFCPFWVSEKKGQKFEVELSHPKIPDEPKIYYEESLKAYEAVTNMHDTNSIWIFHNYFNKTMEIPTGTMIEEKQYMTKTPLKVKKEAVRLTPDRLKLGRQQFAIYSQNFCPKKRSLFDFALQARRKNIYDDQ